MKLQVCLGAPSAHATPAPIPQCHKTPRWHWEVTGDDCVYRLWSASVRGGRALPHKL
uniref:Uncharacterized protein n=1 Tax=Arundo donax TaxID=35708 RepID=A0A0A9BTH2_ARUDO